MVRNTGAPALLMPAHYYSTSLNGEITFGYADIDNEDGLAVPTAPGFGDAALLKCGRGRRILVWLKIQ